jgi:hypothetical protein
VLINIHPALTLEVDARVENYPEIKKYMECFDSIMDGCACQDPLVTISVDKKLTVPRSAHWMGSSCAFDSEFLYRVDPWGRVLAYKFVDEKAAVLVWDGLAEEVQVLYTLEYLLRTLAPLRGLAYLHAAGITYQDKVIILPAWGGAGKTTCLLQMLSRGAALLGDDFVILNKQGWAYPYPKPIYILHYNLDQFPMLASACLGTTERRYYRAEKMLKQYAGSLLRKHGVIGGVFRQLERRLQARAEAKTPLRTIFPDCRIAASGLIDLVGFLTAVKGKGSGFTSCNRSAAAQRAVACLRSESEHYGDEAVFYQYAFPSMTDFIRRLESDTECILKEAFQEARNVVEIHLDRADDPTATINIMEKLFTSGKV